MTERHGHQQDAEQDAPYDDDAQALSRGTGGRDMPEAADRNSTTGSTPNEEFVGRVSGDDGGGYGGETGAERRQQAAKESGSGD